MINIILNENEYSINDKLVTHQGMITGTDFIRIVAKKIRLYSDEDNIEELKPDIAYKIKGYVFRLINDDDAIERFKLTKQASESGVGIKVSRFFRISFPEGGFEFTKFIMVAEYAEPVTDKNHTPDMIEDIKQRILDSDLKFHPDFCKKNMVIKDNQIYMIDWDPFYYNEISKNCGLSDFKSIMEYRFINDTSDIKESYSRCLQPAVNRSHNRSRNRNRNRNRSRNLNERRNRSRSRNRNGNGNRYGNKYEYRSRRNRNRNRSRNSRRR